MTPVITNGTIALSTPTGVPVSGDLAALVSDAEGDPVTFALASSPAGGTVSLAPGGAFTYTPAAGFVGTDTFTFTADDGVVAPVDPPAPEPDEENPEFELEAAAVRAAAVSAPMTVTIAVGAAQVTSTTSPTPTTAGTLARTGPDSGTAAGGLLAVLAGLAMVGASSALVNRASARRAT